MLVSLSIRKVLTEQRCASSTIDLLSLEDDINAEGY